MEIEKLTPKQTNRTCLLCHHYESYKKNNEIHTTWDLCCLQCKYYTKHDNFSPTFEPKPCKICGSTIVEYIHTKSTEYSDEEEDTITIKCNRCGTCLDLDLWQKDNSHLFKIMEKTNGEIK